jgi:hypothetical protein
MDVSISEDDADWSSDGVVHLQLPGSCAGPMVLMHVFSTPDAHSGGPAGG